MRSLPKFDGYRKFHTLKSIVFSDEKNLVLKYFRDYNTDTTTNFVFSRNMQKIMSIRQKMAIIDVSDSWIHVSVMKNRSIELSITKSLI